jgi:signal peptidase II
MSNTRKTGFYTFYLLIFLAGDQITKAFFGSRDFFVGFIHLHALKNRALSFGINFGDKVNFIILAIAIVLFLIYFVKNFRLNKIGFWLLLILAGAALNLFDRIYFGFVRDFIDLGLGFTFNLADLYILTGLAGLLFSPKSG